MGVIIKDIVISAQRTDLIIAIAVGLMQELNVKHVNKGILNILMSKPQLRDIL